MTVLAIVLCVLFIWLSVKTLKAASALEHEIKKYEFENRTSGGVVEFKSYEASLEHNGKKAKVSQKRIVASLFITAAIFSCLLLFTEMVRP